MVPVLLGAGTRLFDDPGGSIGMETIELIRTDAATDGRRLGRGSGRHLEYEGQSGRLDEENIVGEATFVDTDMSPGAVEGMSRTEMDPQDSMLAVHIAAGTLGLVLGAQALWTERAPTYRSRAGSAYRWAVLAVALSAIALVALDSWTLWWLAPLAVLSYGLALVGYLAPARPRNRAWTRVYAHGQGGSYIALVTALLVVSLAGPAAIAAAIVPTLIGLPLIERRVAHISREASTPWRHT